MHDDEQVDGLIELLSESAEKIAELEKKLEGIDNQKEGEKKILGKYLLGELTKAKEENALLTKKLEETQAELAEKIVDVDDAKNRPSPVVVMVIHSSPMKAPAVRSTPNEAVSTVASSNQKFIAVVETSDKAQYFNVAVHEANNPVNVTLRKKIFAPKAGSEMNLAISNDGQNIATASNGRINLFNKSITEKGGLVMGHYHTAGVVSQIAFSPDSSTVTFVEQGKDLLTFSTEGRLLGILSYRNDKGAITALQYSNEGMVTSLQAISPSRFYDPDQPRVQQFLLWDKSGLAQSYDVSAISANNAQKVIFHPESAGEDIQLAINFGDKIAFCGASSFVTSEDAMTLEPVNTFDAPKGESFNHMDYWLSGGQYILATDKELIILNDSKTESARIQTNGKLKSLSVNDSGVLSYLIDGETALRIHQLAPVASFGLGKAASM